MGTFDILKKRSFFYHSSTLRARKPTIIWKRSKVIEAYPFPRYWFGYPRICILINYPFFCCYFLTKVAFQDHPWYLITFSYLCELSFYIEVSVPCPFYSKWIWEEHYYEARNSKGHVFRMFFFHDQNGITCPLFTTYAVVFKVQVMLVLAIKRVTMLWQNFQ